MSNQQIVCIDWKEFILSLIEGYKKIIIIIIVGCIFGFSLCFISGKNISVQNKVAENDKNVSEAKKILSDARIKEVNQNFSSYKNLINQRLRLQKFMKNSIYLNLDESHAKSNTIVYSVEGNRRLNTLINGYSSLIKNKELFFEINKRFKNNNSPEVEEAYLNELISISLPDMNTAYVMNTTTQTSRSFTVTVYGKNESQCKMVSSCLRAQIKSITRRLKKSFGSFNIVDSGDTFEPVISTQINQSRSDYDDKLTTINNAIMTINNSLTDDQKTYLNALIDSQLGNKTKIKSEKRVNINAIVEFSLLGGFIFTLCYIVFKILQYLFDHKVHSNNEFVKNTGVNIITSVNGKKAIDINVAAEELKYIAQKCNPKEIGLLSTIRCLKEEESIHGVLEKSGIDYKMVPATPETEEDFNILLTLKKAIIFEKIGQTKYDDLEKMLRYYELKGIDIIGAVLIK